MLIPIVPNEVHLESRAAEQTEDLLQMLRCLSTNVGRYQLVRYKLGHQL